MGAAIMIITSLLPLIADAPEVVSSVSNAVKLLQGHDGSAPFTAEQQKAIDDALAAIAAKVQDITC